MDLRELRLPTRQRCAADPSAAGVMLRATGTGGERALSCSADIGRVLQAAGPHPGRSGAGISACSGDLLLGVMAAYVRLACEIVTANAGLDEARSAIPGVLSVVVTGPAHPIPVPHGVGGVRVADMAARRSRSHRSRFRVRRLRRQEPREDR